MLEKELFYPRTLFHVKTVSRQVVLKENKFTLKDILSAEYKHEMTLSFYVPLWRCPL